jgi:CRISPR system Cascade subunit CasA
MTDPPDTFNLWTEPWIRVTHRDGSGTELGISACLADAHELVGLHDPSPLVAAGTHRLLTAILQAIYAPQDLGEIATVLRSGQFNQAALDDFAAQHAARFDLFHPTAPFLQTGDIPLDGLEQSGKGETKSVAYLFQEVPSGSGRSLYHHVIDEGHKICPACCARGLITIPAFAMSGGSGIRPSINADPPIYVLPMGDSLFESLACSLVEPNYLPKAAKSERSALSAWTGETTVNKGYEVAEVGYLESLTFPSRRVRLFPEAKTSECTQCGEVATVIVSRMVFEMGHYRPKTAVVWDDPFVAFRAPRGKNKQDDTGPKPVRPEAGKAFWREYSTLLLAQNDGQMRPRVVQQIGAIIEDYRALKKVQAIQFRCVSVRNPSGKVIIYEWLDEALEAPLALLTDDDAAGYIDQAIERAENVRFILESSFDSHFRPERDRGGRNEKLARFKTIRARMTADYWRWLAPLFRQFIFDLADEAAREGTERKWADGLLRLGRQAFMDAADQVGERADALRARVEAQAACIGRLSKKRREWFDEQQ